MGPDAASVRRRSIDARRFGERGALRFGREMARPSRRPRLRRHLRDAGGDRIAPAPPAAALRSSPRGSAPDRRSAAPPPIAPHGPAIAVEGGKGFRAADGGQ